jgi:hypothetical protein
MNVKIEIENAKGEIIGEIVLSENSPIIMGEIKEIKRILAILQNIPALR